MGFLDALKGLTRPYDEEVDFFDDEEELFDDEEEVQQPAAKAPGARRSANPFFSTDTPEYDEPEEEEEAAPAARPSFMSRKRDYEPRERRMAPPAGGNKIVFMKPDSYEDTKAIYDHLRSRRIVLMSLDDCNKEVARRILDFMAGAAYASEGRIARVSSGTYIITPKNVDMMGGDMMDELENSGLFF